MAYTIITTNKTFNIGSSNINSSHIGSIYGGLQNTNGQVSGNLKLDSITAISDQAWCTCSLQDTGDNTASKLLVTCTANTGNDRTSNIKLKSSSAESPTSIIIKQAGSGGSSETTPIEYTFTFKFNGPGDGIFADNVSLDSVKFSTKNRYNGSDVYYMTGDIRLNIHTNDQLEFLCDVTFKNPPGIQYSDTYDGDSTKYLPLAETATRLYVFAYMDIQPTANFHNPIVTGQGVYTLGEIQYSYSFFKGTSTTIFSPSL